MFQRDEPNLWHQRVGHLNFRDLARLNKKEITKDFPKLSNIDKPLCKSCQMRKQTRIPHKKTTQIETSRPLELLHIELSGPTKMETLGGKKHFIVVVNDFPHFT